MDSNVNGCLGIVEQNILGGLERLLEGGVRLPMRRMAGFQLAMARETMALLSKSQGLWLEGLELYLRKRREMTDHLKTGLTRN
jgi:hypothetical protein